MFSVEERDLIRRRLLNLADQDPAVVAAAAITGSHATRPRFKITARHTCLLRTVTAQTRAA